MEILREETIKTNNLKWLLNEIKLLYGEKEGERNQANSNKINNMIKTVDNIQDLLSFSLDIKFCDEGYKDSVNRLNDIVLRCLEPKEINLNNFGDNYFIESYIENTKVNLLFQIKNEIKILLTAYINDKNLIINFTCDEIEFCIEKNQKTIMTIKYFNSKTQNYAIVTENNKKEIIEDNVIDVIKRLLEKDYNKGYEDVVKFLNNQN